MNVCQFKQTTHMITFVNDLMSILCLRKSNALHTQININIKFVFFQGLNKFQTSPILCLWSINDNIFQRNVPICSEYYKWRVRGQIQQFNMKPTLKELILLLGLLLLSSCQFMSYEEYLDEFEPDFPSNEAPTRQANYAATIGILEDLLTQNLTWDPEVTKFAAWSTAEIEELKGLLLEENDDNQNNPQVTRKLGNPTSLDWTDEDQAVSSVKDQGQCGSCWAFAAVAYAESKLLLDDRYDSIDLSEQELLECTASSSCAGGYLENAIDELLDEVPFQFLFPYDPEDTDSTGICEAGGVQVGEQAENFYSLSDSQLIDLLQDRPIAISVSAENWEYYGSGIMACGPQDPINHAVLLVGYTPEYWLIKNSWGRSWGENGYIRVTRTANNNCRIGYSAHRTFEWKLTACLGIALAILVVLL